jgi:hypothetical protein
MSSQPQPQPVSDTYNLADWNREQTLTVAGATYRFLSKRVSDIAFGVISFAQGLQSNLITVYTGTVLSIGSVSNTVNLFNPILSSTVPANTDNSTSIISSAWVNSFWTYVRTQAYSWSGIQTFTNGITTNLLATTTNSTALAIAGNNETGSIFIANSSTRTGSILIGAKALFPPSNIIIVGSSGVTSTTVNGNTVNVGTNSTNIVVNIGNISTITNIYSPLLSSTIPANTSNDTSIISSAWVNSFWTYVKTLANTWADVQTFSALPLITASYAAITGANTSNTIITANWLNATWLPYLRGLANTWDDVQTFTSSISLSAPITITYSYPVSAGFLGERIDGAVIATFFALNTSTNISSVSLTKGVWMIVGHQTNPAVAANYQLCISTTSNVRQRGIAEMTVTGNTTADPPTAINITGTVSHNTTTSYFLVSRCNVAVTSGSPLTFVVMYAYRIA